LEKLTPSERDKILREMVQFRNAFDFKTEMLIRQLYGTDDFGFHFK